MADALTELIEQTASLKARVAELEANERAYEAALGQRTYNEVALHIKELTEALRDIVDPVVYLQRLADQEGTKLDGAAAVHFANNSYNLRMIARAALTNGDAS